MYAIVENNTVLRYIKELPKQHIFANGSRTGNFDMLDTAAQIAEGYYPVVDVRPSVDPRIEALELDSVTVGQDAVTRTYVVAAKDVELVRSGKIQEIERKEASLTASSLFLYDEKVWTLSAESSQNVDGLQTAMSLPGATFPSPFSWTDAYGTEVPMSEAYFQGFAGAMLTAKLTISGASKAHVAAVKALDNALDIANYDYSAGWGNYVEPVPEGDLI